MCSDNPGSGASGYPGGIGIIGIQVHFQAEAVLDSDLHVMEYKAFVSFNFYLYEIAIRYAKSLGINAVHVDVAVGHNGTL